MTVADAISFKQSKRAGKNFDKLILVSYIIFAVVGLFLICVASTKSGMSSGELASMVAFP